MELKEPDKSGRRHPQEIVGSNYIIDTDMVILALGSRPNPTLPSLIKDLNVNNQGHIIIDDNYMTSVAGIFAGGDIVIGGGTVISAMEMGKKAAKAINVYLKN
jgi:glutamate synthase (NADPH/NADH) small chain